MNKTLLYGVTLVVLSLIVWFAVLKPGGSSLEDDAQFAVDDTADISMIFMADRSGNQIKLERIAEDAWTVNGKHPVFPPAMELILRTLQTIEVSYPVSEAAHENIAKLMTSDATKVEIYTGDEKASKTFFVGGPTNDQKGTYMSMDGAKQLYVTKVPVFQGYIGTRFFLREVDWRDRTVFNHQLDAITDIQIHYPARPDYSFEMSIKDGAINLISPLDIKAGPDKIIDEYALKSYLLNFRKKAAEGFENEYFRKDSVLATPPFCEVLIVENGSDSNVVSIYHKPVSQRTKEQFDTEDGTRKEYDSDRYFALINKGKDFVIIQHFTLGKIFMRYQDFFKSEEETSVAKKRIPS